MNKKANKNNNINVNLQALNSQTIDNHLPPQNIEAEQSVLGALMIDKNAIIRIGDFLKSESFYKRNHQLIYTAILELFNQQESIDLLSVSAKLEEKGQLESIGGRTYLAGLVNAVPTSSHVYSYAKIVSKKKVLRDIIDASFYLAQLGYNEDAEIEQILDAAEKKVFSIAQQSFTQEFASIKEPLTEAFARFDRLHQTKDKKLRGVATGFQDLDSRYLSGLQKTDLITLASRPRIGKTSLALDIAQNVASQEKKAVGIFSLEMSTDQLVDRLIAKRGRIDLWKLRTGNLADHDFDAIQQSLDQLSRAPIYIDDGMSSNVLQMRAMARRLQAQTDLGLIIVDYLQLMEPATKTDSRTQEISQISRSLKALARELDVPVLALSQLSRAVEHRSYSIPKLSDLRESGSIEQDSDVVMFIYREEKAPPEVGLSPEGQVIVAKNRNGPTGNVPVVFKEKWASYESMAKRPGEAEEIEFPSDEIQPPM
jgi:replicative DNA helicase